MKLGELLRVRAELAFDELIKSVEPVDQGLSWAVVPMKEGEYMNSNGSILTMVQHVAGCKVAYGSIGFRNSETRWRDLADRYEVIGSDWAASLVELREAQTYWLNSWSHLTDGDLERPTLHFSGKDWPAWRIISTVTEHDIYHTGQIEVLKVSLAPSAQEPPSTAEDIRQYCRDLPNW